MPRLSKKMKKLVEETMRRDILDASVEIILAEGVDGLTTDKLAKKLEISRGTLYNYFVNKDDIIHCLCERNFNAFLEAIDAIAASPDSADAKLKQIAGHMIRDFSAQRQLHSALLAKRPPKRRDDFLKNHQILLGKITQIIDSGIASGQLATIEPAAAAIIFFGGLREICFSHTAGLLEVTTQDMIDMLDAMLIEPMRAG